MALKVDRILQGDCVAELARLPEGCVDLAFADPPYNIGYDYDSYDDNRSGEEYVAWCREWIAGVRRVLQPNGAFWLAIGDEFAAELKVLATRELGFFCRSWVVWFYTFGVHCTKKFTRSHAHLFHFVRNAKRFTFNGDAIRVPSARQLVYGDKRAVEGGRVPDDTWMMAPVLPPEVPTRDGFILRPQDIPERFPPHGDTWFFSRVAGTFKERQGFHGCQMPEQLLGRIIRSCSNEGELVLDPFAGSGTTLAVAKKLGRSFVGVELSKEYVGKIRKRLAVVHVGDALDGPEDAARSAPRTKTRGRPSRMASRPSVVCRSAVVTRANVSLGQVAVANGELATAIAEAFMCSHEGYSADRVLADPQLNDAFLSNCRLLSIPGDARDWNHLLLNIRKAGSLGSIDTSRRTMIPRNHMASFMFASEMAWRTISKESDASLDDILCDPDLRNAFDSRASLIAPGHTPLEYRWAALSIRKDASKGRRFLDRLTDSMARRVFRISDRHRMPASPGHYLIMAGGGPFFVGFSALHLRDCPAFQWQHLEPALGMLGQGSTDERDIEITTRNFNYNEMQMKLGRATQVECWAPQRARLLARFKPIGNIPLPRPAA